MKLGIPAIAVLSAASCCASGADVSVTQGAPVVVTATRFSAPAQQFPVGVQVVNEEDIKRTTASTLPELLSQFAGIRTRDLSGSPDLQVDMRGFGISGDQNTLVLLDGRRISENEQATVNWTAIPLSAIERIEIMRGAGSVLYGAGATGGTINIITKAPRLGERSASIYGGAGSYDAREARAGVNIGGERASMRLNASHFRTDNYRDNNELRQSNAQADLRINADRGFISLKTGADDQRLELPGALSEAQITANRRQAATPGDFSTRRGGYIDVGGEQALGLVQVAANVSYREKETDASFFVATPFRNNIESRVSVWSFTPRVKIPHRIGGADSALVTGVDVDDWQFDASAGPAIVGRPTGNQRNTAIYAQHTTSFTTGTSLSLGARDQSVKYAVSDPTNPAASFSRERTLKAYEVAARQRLGEGLSIYGKLGSSFRIPNVNDLYSLFTASITPLEPQTARDREIGTEGSWGPARFRLSYYHIDISNEIFFDPLTFTNRNLPPTRRSGVEAEARWTRDTLHAFVNYTYAVAQFRSGNFGGISIAGNDVPLVPRHAANAGVSWRFMPQTQAHVVVRYVGDRPYDADETNQFGRRMPSYTVVDTKLTHEQRDWSFNAGVRNLFNEKYYTYGVFTGFPTFAALPAPERSFFVSAQYTVR
ncbi:MAG: TonB-dependent receptor [Burkholderiales bacterium]